jgi:hypothetical protein
LSSFSLQGLLEDYRILTQQIKLKNLIIACFIPPDYQDKIMQHCHWMDYEGAWSIDLLPYAGNAIRSHQELSASKGDLELFNCCPSIDLTILFTAIFRGRGKGCC